MKLKTIKLPKVYEYIEGESRPEYKKYAGKQKISLSQINSFQEELYRGNYLGGYFLEIKDDGNIFSRFGNAVGDYFNRQDQRIDPYLSEEDKAIIDKIKTPENANFEYEILIDLEPFGLKDTVCQGFSDLQYEVSPKVLDVADMKTLTMKNKKDFYASEEYKQLNLYGYGLEELGFKIRDTYVIGMGRLGNTDDKSAVSKAGNPLHLRLSGEILRIDNPYNREQAIKDIKGMCKTVVMISDYFSVYNKYFKSE